MRYRLMATYRGVSYEAGIGPTDADVVLFASNPPPEEPGFEPAAGYWRKRISREKLDAIWEARPIGQYRSEPCLVLDEIGHRLHITYLGHDGYRAKRLGYWQVDRGVYEVIVARDEVTELSEARVDYPARRKRSAVLSDLPPHHEATTSHGTPPTAEAAPAPDRGPSWRAFETPGHSAGYGSTERSRNGGSNGGPAGQHNRARWLGKHRARLGRREAPERSRQHGPRTLS